LNARCGGLWAWTELVADPDDLGRMRGLLFAEVKAWPAGTPTSSSWSPRPCTGSASTEHDRLRELIEQALQSLQERVQGAGHALAALAASRGFGGAAATGHRLGGLGRLAWLKRLAPTIAEGAPTAASALTGLADGLAALQRKIADNLRHLAVIGDAAKSDEVLAAVRQAWSAASAEKTVGEFPAPAAFAVAPTAFTTPTAVSYCALAFPTVPSATPTRPPWRWPAGC